MFGAAYGDVIGSYYEWHSTKTYDFPFQFHSTFTDDTVLTAAVCEAILNHPDHLDEGQMHARAIEYAALFRQYYSRYPNAGFGGMFQRWAKGGSFEAIKSYGNGAAMRVSPIGWAYDTLEQTLFQAKASCMITHYNKEAIYGAQAVASAIYLARHGENKASIAKYIHNTFGYDLSKRLADIRPTYSFDSRSLYSVPPSIIAFLESEDYESAIRNAVSLGGDADTMAAIAGGIAQAYYGEIPEHIKHFCDARIDASLRMTIRKFEKNYNGKD